MSTAKGYHDALLTLSGNPVFAAARDALLASISDNELLDVITHGLKTGSPRETLNAIATRLLDGLATAGRVGDAVPPVEGNHGGRDDEGDHDDSGDVGGRKDSGGSSGHVARRGDARWPIQTALQKPTETPTTKGTRSSTADNKRTGDCLMQDGKKRRYVSPDPMDDEEDIVKAEKWVENKAANDIAKGTEQASSNATKTASSASDTDSDTDTSLDQDTPWKRTQKLSVMPDLNLVDSDDEDDEDYSGDAFPIPLPTSRIKKTIQIPNIDLSFWVPTAAKDSRSKSLNDFPIAFVKWAIRKFNEDYLKTSRNRELYQKMVEKSYNGNKCVERRLDKYWAPASWVKPNVKWTCNNCQRYGKLCAKFTRTHEGKATLVIYPLVSSGVEDWQSTDYWVRKSIS
ncbi:uncharacterized protein J4E88_010957 [Alternaria novae-zelandiae]|uniref:uncharacterized protein n=1 Tax=Alternaria novae-zelandiae TaxID=430562 RepID=UPI0020C272FA|nr:uncharacterized protein J4E88_010957 [Alternaria novae-zelandiae]KAI4661509.1 hypothetical protein J4E88_010957 [Alternaria novae-zelandiae]